MDYSQAQDIIGKMDRHEIIWDDNLRAQANNVLNGSGGNSANSVIQSSIDAYTKVAEEQWKKSKEFATNNPFNFDDVLAKEYESVASRLDPYYKQTLSDYLKGVTTKRERSLENERTLLTTLQADIQDYTGNEKIALDKTLERTRQGYADAGTFYSGMRRRAEGMATSESQTGMETYLRGQGERKNQITTDTQRTGADLTLEQSMKERELGRIDPLTGEWLTNPATGKAWRGVEPEYQIRAQALPEAERKQSLWQYEQSQYAGTPAGVNYTDWSKTMSGLLTG